MGAGSFKIGHPRSRGGKILDLDGQRGWGVLKIRQFPWTSCLSSFIQKLVWKIPDHC